MHWYNKWDQPLQLTILLQCGEKKVHTYLWQNGQKVGRFLTTRTQSVKIKYKNTCIQNSIIWRTIKGRDNLQGVYKEVHKSFTQTHSNQYLARRTAHPLKALYTKTAHRGPWKRLSIPYSHGTGGTTNFQVNKRAFPCSKMRLHWMGWRIDTARVVKTKSILIIYCIPWFFASFSWSLEDQCLTFFKEMLQKIHAEDQNIQ